MMNKSASSLVELSVIRRLVGVLAVAVLLALAALATVA
jgi:hypothetical protein